MLYIIQEEVHNLASYVKIKKQGDYSIALKHSDDTKHEIINFENAQERDDEYIKLLKEVNNGWNRENM